MTYQKSPADMAIPPLLDGGVMLTYRCTNTCRHCLYRCSPNRPGEWMTEATAERVFAALADEPRLNAIHLAGGEAAVAPDRLIDILNLAHRYRIRLSYLETNAAWCVDDRTTRRTLHRLRDAGLPAVLVSASMFHNEFIAFARTRRCVEAAWEVFGPGGVIVWVDHLYRMLAQMGSDQATRSVEEFCEQVGLDPARLPSLYHLTPGGRVTEALRDCYPKQPAGAFAGDGCADELAYTHHFHIDPHGNLFTGLCPGIAVGSADEFHPEITPERFPVFAELWSAGPAALADRAEAETEFAHRPDGYVSKCDLCLHARKALHATGRYAELTPAEFYGD